jgi:hypothetical protein
MPGTLRIWQEPLVSLRFPKLFNLRTDPYEGVIVKSCGRDARSGGLTPRVVSWWDSYFSVLFVNSIYELHPGTNQRQ